MNWIRMATRMKSDPKVGRIAMECGVPMSHAVGLVCCTLMEFPEHARDGDIAHVADVILEEWAGWRGEPGRFSAVFRTQFCDATGLVASWDKHNGAAIREADAARERAATWRETKKSPPRTGNVRRTEPVPNGVRTAYETHTVRHTYGVPNGVRTPLRDGTGRDGDTTSPLRAEVVSDRPAALAELTALPFTTPEHANAAAGYARAHQFPDAFRATLTAVATGMHGPPVSWEVIGRALVEMQGAGARFTPNALRAFAAKLTDAPKPEPSWDSLLVPLPQPEPLRDVA